MIGGADHSLGSGDTCLFLVLRCLLLLSFSSMRQRYDFVLHAFCALGWIFPASLSLQLDVLCLSF